MDSQVEQCLNENLLRAYLDEAKLLPATTQARLKQHLTHCQSCQERLAALEQQINQVNNLLEIAMPANKVNVPDPKLALNRLRPHYTQALTPAAPAKSSLKAKKSKTLVENTENSPGKSWLLAAFGVKLTRVQTWVATAAVIILTISLVTLTPLSAAASQLLQIFRVHDTVFVPVNQDQVKQLVNSSLQFNNFFSSMPAFTSKPTAPHPVDTVEAASKAVGFGVQRPQTLPGPITKTEILVRDGFSVQFQLNVAALRQMLALMKINDVTLPDELGSQPIKAELANFVEEHFEGKDYQLVLYQSLSPQLNLPDKVDLAQLSQLALRLLGMDAKQAQSLSQQIDLRSALIFPFPAQANNFRQVSIGSSKGLLVNSGERGQPSWLLYWQQGEHFFVLSGTGRIEDLDMLAAANSLAG